MARRGFRLVVVAVAFACCNFSVATVQEPSNEAIFERLVARRKDALSSGVFAGDEDRYTGPRALSDDKFDEELDAAEASIRQRAKDGQLFDAEMVADFSTRGMDARRPEQFPEVQSIVDDMVAHVRDEVETRLIQEGKASRTLSTFKTFLDAGKNLRVERDEKDHLEDERSLRRNGERQILTVNDERTVHFNETGKSAVIYPGTKADPSRYEMATGNFDFRRAGLPNLMFYQASQLREVVHETSSEGPMLKLTFVDEPKPGVGNVLILWVLPERDYSVARAKYFMLGTLMSEEIFGRFEKLSTGRWYPMNQTRIDGLRDNLKDDVRQKLKDGKLSLADPEVLNAPMLPYRISLKRTLTKVELTADFQKDLFDQTLPSDCTVHDMRR